MKSKFYQIVAVSFLVWGCSSKEVKPVSTESFDESEKNEYAVKDTSSKTSQVEMDAPANSPIKQKTVGAKAAAAAAVEFRKGHFDTALGLINKAIKEQPDKSEHYHNLGLIHLAKNEQREAVKAFRKGLQVNSKDAAIGAQLGAIFTKEKDYNKAELALEIPVDKGTQDPQILNNYAIALTANKKISEAEKIYEKALKLSPGSRDIMLNYSIFLIDQKQKYKQGLDLLNRLKFVGVQSEARNIIKDLENRAKAGLK